MSRWPPAWIQATHPLYRREHQRWSRLTVWQNMRWGCLPLIVILMAPPALCMLVLIGDELLTEPILPGTLFIGIVIALQWLVSGLITIMGTIGGALTIAPEREAQTWELLRLTTLRTTEIIGSKVSAVLSQLWPLILIVIGLRMLAIGLTYDLTIMESGRALAPTIIETLKADGVNGLSDIISELRQLGTLSAGSLLLIGLYTIIVFIIALNWVLGSVWRTVYAVLIGTLASSFVRSANAAIAMAFGLQFMIFAAGATLGYILQTLVFSGILFIEQIERLANSLTVFALMPAVGFVSVIFNILVQFAIMAIAAQITLSRARHLQN